MLHLIYVENVTIQEVASELGLSERQAYRDLKRGQEAVAAALWTNRLPSAASLHEYSLQSEVAHLKLNFSLVDVGAIFQQARQSVARLAVRQSVEIAADSVDSLLIITDPPLAHQVIISALSYAIQQAQPGLLTASFETSPGATALNIRYRVNPEASPALDTRAALSELAQRLHWTISYQETPTFQQVTVTLISRTVTILVIDDNEGWIALLERFLEGLNCRVVTPSEPDRMASILKLTPNAIILDVMMPETDGWEILQRLRAQPETAQIPVIVCSVFNDPQLAYSLGASAFVSKSTNLDQISAVLKELSII